MLGEKNRALWWVTAVTLVLLALTLAVPFLQGLFRFAPVSMTDVLICTGAGVIVVGLMEMLKLFRFEKKVLQPIMIK